MVQMLRGLELQLRDFDDKGMSQRTRARIIKTEKGEALVIEFALGPLKFCIIANLPETDDDDELPIVYIKVSLADDSREWPVLETHPLTNGRPRAPGAPRGRLNGKGMTSHNDKRKR